MCYGFAQQQGVGADPPVVPRPGQNRLPPNTRAIEGLVRDAKGAPVKNAVVLLKDTKTLQVRSYIAQEDGKYHFYGLNSDVNYQVRAENADMTSPTSSSVSSIATSTLKSNLKLKKKKKPTEFSSRQPLQSDKRCAGLLDSCLPTVSLGGRFAARCASGKGYCMKCREIIDRIKEIGVVPIVRTSSAEMAIHSVEAIYEGGIPCVEITMTVDGAIKALEAVADRYGDRIILGAGTVLDPETARICMLAGAQFFVTPSLNTKTIEFAKRYSKPIFPER